MHYQNTRYKYTVASIILCFSFLLSASALSAETCTLSPGDIVKSPAESAVYLITPELERKYFPNAQVYYSWYSDFSRVQTVSAACLATYRTPSNAPYGVNFKPGSFLVKSPLAPAVYSIDETGALRKITSESTARSLYGNNWASRVVDIAPVFWSNYVLRSADLIEATPTSSTSPSSPISPPSPSPPPAEPTPSPSTQPDTPQNNEPVLSAVWANTGEDKITRDELRGSSSATAVHNSVWDGTSVSLTGAKNEVVGFSLILESKGRQTNNIAITFDTLTGPNGATIQTTNHTNLFDWTTRPIELFYVRYLQIKGLSRMSYELYDERHIPERLRRPFDEYGIGNGTWTDRPDHDAYYPDIAVPLELEPSFDIRTNESQMIWGDIYVPKSSPAGTYHGTITVSVDGQIERSIPVSLEVYNFTLPDEPTAKTMLPISHGNINNRYIGETWPNPGTANGNKAIDIRNEHFKLAHRHKISLVDADFSGSDRPSDEWIPRLDGSLFTAAHGYAGPGVGIGNNIYVIGLYGQWGWKDEGEAGMHEHTDAWKRWFTDNFPAVEHFLYLVDEPSDLSQVNEWTSWIESNDGPGKELMSMSTIPVYRSYAETPNLDVHASGVGIGVTNTWQEMVDALTSDPDKRFYAVNATRPGEGSFATEDDGIALRELSWGQYKKQIDRWFFWESTYYNNYQANMGETNVFATAHTFGGHSHVDPSIGETGWNYSNGDGVLFYPGSDNLFPEESYNIDGPIASLRLKYWRRGIQDVDYLVLAAQKNPARVAQIIQEMVPKAMWEYGVADENDPTWLRTDISWSTNPDDWEAARKELAEIIQ